MASDAVALTFAESGAECFPGVLAPEALKSIEEAIGALPSDAAGIRLHGLPRLTPHLTSTGTIGAVAASILGDECRAVRAILFDKTAAANWSLGWHQDRTIAVKERINVEGYGPWTVKNGLIHVEPPFDLLADMVTLRAHLDAVAATNAPLLIAPGSHRLGRIAVRDIPEVVEHCGTVACLADRSDVWLYATPILHASERAAHPSHRRVLQVDFARAQLPGGLHWLGV